MNINELEQLAIEWNRFDADNEYSQSFLELIAAYRKSVAALCSVIDWDIRREYIVPYSVRDPIHRTLDTAKRLGVE